jgi:hypothetical protein
MPIKNASRRKRRWFTIQTQAGIPTRLDAAMRFLKATVRSRKARWFAVCLLLAAGGVAWWWYTRNPLEQFVGRDLRKLDADESQIAALFRKTLGRLLPEEFTSSKSRLYKVLDRVLPKEYQSEAEWRAFGGLEPWYLWRYQRDSEQCLILFQANSSFPHPGSTRITVHFLKSDGTHIATSEFHVGWRSRLLDAVICPHELLDTEAISIQTRQTLGGYDSRQYFAVGDDRLILVRIENLAGELIANRYSPTPGFGPAPPDRSAQAWEELLMSGKSCDILDALGWLGADHSVWKNDHYETTALVTSLRAKLSVRQRITALTESDHPWIRQAAVEAKKQLKD